MTIIMGSNCLYRFHKLIQETAVLKVSTEQLLTLHGSWQPGPIRYLNGKYEFYWWNENIHNKDSNDAIISSLGENSFVIYSGQCRI